MSLPKLLILLISHGLAIALGFAAGIYALPILTAPPPPDPVAVAATMQGSAYRGEFSRDRTDSDALHWGEGELSIGPDSVAFMGKLAPGPDYKLYLSPRFVETEADFLQLKAEMEQIGDIKTFESFLLDLPEGVDPANYKAAIVWCESFSQFITSATYEPVEHQDK